ncbi:hypothetical protein BLNAU_21798 [Blattamonas nauphoetae]|uniref:Transmembrane protein n=1 Tax=Blattamonas nauphoetae TaxID=2049346 RepID=A0ABQ9WUV0_9EUKA|nr:hypothetical protein BLNAU_21798 [Blattamonas nauphoetae]
MMSTESNTVPEGITIKSRYRSVIFSIIALLSAIGLTASLFLYFLVGYFFGFVMWPSFLVLVFSILLDLYFGAQRTLHLEPELNRVIMRKKRSFFFHLLCCCINTPTRNTETYELSNLVSATILPSTRRSAITFNFVDGSVQSQRVTFKREEAYSFATVVNSMIQTRFPRNQFMHNHAFSFNGLTPFSPYMHNPVVPDAYQSSSAPTPDLTAPEELPGGTPKNHEIS